jgi:hypothetical protein
MRAKEHLVSNHESRFRTHDLTVERKIDLESVLVDPLVTSQQ